MCFKKFLLSIDHRNPWNPLWSSMAWRTIYASDDPRQLASVKKAPLWDWSIKLKRWQNSLEEKKKKHEKGDENARVLSPCVFFWNIYLQPTDAQLNHFTNKIHQNVANKVQHNEHLCLHFDLCAICHVRICKTRLSCYRSTFTARPSNKPCNN